MGTNLRALAEKAVAAKAARDRAAAEEADPEGARQARRQSVEDAARDASTEIDKYNASEDISTRDKALSFAQGAADTMSLGLADEARGVMALQNPMTLAGIMSPMNIARGITGSGPTVPGFADVYANARDTQREAQAITQEVAPLAYGVGGVAGALPAAVGGIGASGAAAAQGLIGSAMQGAKVAGATGAVQGFGTGEGLTDSAIAAAEQGLVSALFGGGAGAAGRLATKAGRDGVAEGAANALKSVKGAVAGASGKASAAAARVEPTVSQLLARADALDPVAKGMLAVASGGKLNAAIEALRFLKKAAGGAGALADDAASVAAAVPESVSSPAAAAVVEATPPVAAPQATAAGATASKTTRKPSFFRVLPRDIVESTPVGPPAAVESAPMAPKSSAAAPTQPVPAAVEPVSTPAEPAVRPRARRLSQDEETALIRATAIENGTRDVATLSSKAGISSSATSAALQRLTKKFEFVDAVEKAAAAKAAAAAPATPPPADLVEGIAAGNTGGKVTDRTLRQTAAVQKKAAQAVTIGDFANQLRGMNASNRGAFLRYIVREKGKDFAVKVAKEVGMSTKGF